MADVQLAAATSVPGQLAFLLGPVNEDPDEAIRETIEVRIADEDDERARHAIPAPACRCRRPWSMGEGRCWKCGRDLEAVAR